MTDARLSWPARAARLARTVRWLRAEQVVGRVRFRLARPRPDLSPPPPRRAPTASWVAPPEREPSLVGPTRMRFLGEEHDLSEVGWDDPRLALLWRYNQHYFDDLGAREATARRAWHQALITRWVRENPPGRGTGWAPYPTSLRIVNWIKAFAGGLPPETAWIDSLAVQARWLTKRLEWHLLGNHLFVNAKALVFAGLWFDGAEAEAWLARGLAILERELPEQVLADGVHFERSPMYHALALEDLLDLVDAARWLAPAGSPVRDRFEPAWRATAGAMLRALHALQLEAGDLARFNDCSPGIAPPVEALQACAAALDVPAAPAPPAGVLHLAASGYVRASRGEALLLVDAAPVGPDYLPGHAHADTLSFEFALRGRAIVVNRGTSVYGTGPRRLIERGTAAHSTVQLDGLDSSEVWSGFRVGRRARPGPVAIDGCTIGASHDGYSHLPGAPRHHRVWRLGEASLQVDDRIEPESRRPALARYHLAPGLSAEPAGGGRWSIRSADPGAAPLATFTVQGSAGGQAFLERWQHALGFGHLVDTVTLAVPLHEGHASATFEWAA